MHAQWLAEWIGAMSKLCIGKWMLFVCSWFRIVIVAWLILFFSQFFLVLWQPRRTATDSLWRKKHLVVQQRRRIIASILISRSRSCHNSKRYIKTQQIRGRQSVSLTHFLFALYKLTSFLCKFPAVPVAHSLLGSLKYVDAIYRSKKKRRKTTCYVTVDYSMFSHRLKSKWN